MAVIQDPKKNKRVVRVEPRDFGKSALCLTGAPLWWLAAKLKWYIGLFGAGGSTFWNHYSTLQQELDLHLGNMRLLEDFPHLQPMMDFKHQFVAWNDSKSKVASGAVIEARSMSGRIRGLKEGKTRPDAMMFDDPQDDDTVATDYQRQKFVNRFRTTLLNLIADGGDIYVIGNLLHNDSLVGQLLRDRQWDAKLYRAENTPVDGQDRLIGFPIGNTKQDGSALWPAMWPLERLRQRRDEIKSRAYNIEYMNKMFGADEQTFDSTKFMKFNVEELKLDDSYDIVMFWDPSNPKERREEDADYASITVGATKMVKVKDRAVRYWWIIHNWLRQARPQLQTEEAFRCVELWPVKRVYYEDNGGFGVLLPYIRLMEKEKKIKMPIKMRPETKNKVQKIYSASTMVETRVFFAEHLGNQYFTQWDEFPHGNHDDGPDSTVSLIVNHEKASKGFFNVVVYSPEAETVSFTW